MKFEPKVDYPSLSDGDLAELGLDKAERAFDDDVQTGLTNGDGLCIAVGAVDEKFVKLGERLLGDKAEAAKHLPYIHELTGKLATALNYKLDSVVAYHRFGETIPQGPQRSTGGVYYVAYALTQDYGWLTRVFAGAAAGVQGPIDHATLYTALTRMGAGWVLKQQALYGKG